MPKTEVTPPTGKLYKKMEFSDPQDIADIKHLCLIINEEISSLNITINEKEFRPSQLLMHTSEILDTLSIIQKAVLDLNDEQIVVTSN